MVVDPTILTQTVVVLLKSLFYVYIKYTTAVALVINCMACWEAYTLIKTPAYRCSDGTYSSKVLYPPLVQEVGGDIQLSELLYKKYKLLVFNISYNKVLYGRFFFLKHLTTHQIIKLAFLYLIGINRLTLFVITTIFRLVRGKKYNQVLYELFIHSQDDRILLNLDNKWIANGPKAVLKKILQEATNTSGEKIKFSEHCSKTLQEIADRIKTIDNMKMHRAEFIEKGKPRVWHEVYPEISTKNKLAFQTDVRKARENNNYEKLVMINEYQGPTKPSRMIEHNYEDLKQRTKEIYVSIKPIAVGAIKNGYNPELVSKQFTDVLKELEYVHKLLDMVIAQNNWNVDRDQLFKIMDGLETLEALDTGKD